MGDPSYEDEAACRGTTWATRPAFGREHGRTLDARCMVPSASRLSGSARLECRESDFAVLTGECQLASAAALSLLHAGDVMVAGVVQCDLAIACIDS